MNSQKENRKSQQRKQKARQDDEESNENSQADSPSPEKDENLSNIYLQEIPGSDDGKNSSSSPLKPCPKSPLKRMKSLEQ